MSGPAPAPPSRLRIAGLIVVFLWFFLGGIAHFAATALEESIVPPYIPAPHAVVLVTGVFELLGAAGLMYRPARRTAGLGLCLLTVAVTPANVYMLQHADEYHVPYALLVSRLPVQALLLVLIAWSTGVIGGVSRAVQQR